VPVLRRRHALHRLDAAVIGDNIGYAIGHFGGRRLVLRHGRYVGVRADNLDRVERFFQRYGGIIVVVARFFEILRQLNGVVAGTVGMTWWRFLAFNAVGATLWVGLWGWGVFYLGRHMEQVHTVIKRFEPYAVTTGVLALVGVVVYLFCVVQAVHGSELTGHDACQSLIDCLASGADQRRHVECRGCGNVAVPDIGAWLQRLPQRNGLTGLEFGHLLRSSRTQS
jgi:membrane protein YqaA with SNARE-associated domain